MAAPLRYLLAKAGARCAAAFYAHGGLAGFRCCCRSCSCLCSCPCSCLCSCSCSCSCRARARARARAVLLLLLEPVVLVVPVVALVRGPRAWSSLSTLCRLLVFFLLACLSSCWKSSAGRTPTRQRATFASKVMRSPARRAYLPKRSSQKIHHLAAQSSRAHRPDGANFPPRFFPSAGLLGEGGGQRRPSRRQGAWPPFLAGHVPTILGAKTQK